MVKRTCFIALFCWLLVWGAYYYVVKDLNFDLFPKILLTLFCSLGVVMVAGSLSTLKQNFKLKRMLNSRKPPRPPKDGELIAVSGTISPRLDPLISPILQKSCVAYEYTVSREIHDSSDGSSRQNSSLTGFGLTPSTIKTTFGEVRLLSFPLLDKLPEEAYGSAGVPEHFRKYVSDTKFEKMSIMQAFSQLEKLISDDDGSVKLDIQISSRDVPLEGSNFSEKVVEIGQQVTVIGLYSASKGGIVPKVGKTQELVQFFPGTSQEAARRMSRESRAQMIFSIIFLLFSHAFLAVVLVRAPTY